MSWGEYLINYLTISDLVDFRPPAPLLLPPVPPTSADFTHRMG
jgi:hypothetical protein